MNGPVSPLLPLWTVLLALRSRYDRASERGDVPGWVMVTVMTAGLVAALWALAGPELERMLRDALRSVA
jgi:hypothetical protein